MEVASGEHGDYVQKLVVAVNNGKCSNWNRAARSPAAGAISNDIAKEEGGGGGAVGAGALKVTGPNCTTSLLDSSECMPQPEKASFPTSGLTQFWILLKRTFLSMIRDSQLFRLRLVAHFIIGLLLGLIYYDIGDDASKVTSNAGCIFFVMMFMNFSSMMPTILTCEYL